MTRDDLRTLIVASLSPLRDAHEQAMSYPDSNPPASRDNCPECGSSDRGTRLRVTRIDRCTKDWHNP
jgi:hypothetical protein